MAILSSGNINKKPVTEVKLKKHIDTLKLLTLFMLKILTKAIKSAESNLT